MWNRVTANAKPAERNAIKPAEGFILKETLECSPLVRQAHHK